MLSNEYRLPLVRVNVKSNNRKFCTLTLYYQIDIGTRLKPIVAQPSPKAKPCKAEPVLRMPVTEETAPM